MMSCQVYQIPPTCVDDVILAVHEMFFEDNAVGDAGVYKGAINLNRDNTSCHDHY